MRYGKNSVPGCTRGEHSLSLSDVPLRLLTWEFEPEVEAVLGQRELL